MSRVCTPWYLGGACKYIVFFAPRRLDMSRAVPFSQQSLRNYRNVQWAIEQVTDKQQIGNELGRVQREGPVKKNGYGRTLFFARCCLGKIPGGAPFSQLHKGDRQHRKDRSYHAIIQIKMSRVRHKHGKEKNTTRNKHKKATQQNTNQQINTKQPKTRHLKEQSVKRNVR